jgi:urease accessory protein
MGNRFAVVYVAALVVVASSPAYAHHAEWMHDEPFVQGLSMPIHGLDHLLVAFAVGLLAARLGGAAAWSVPAAFGLFVAIGGLLNVRGVAVPLVEPAILASTLILGAMLVARRAVSTSLALLAVGALAVIQGSALLPVPADPVVASTLGYFTLGCLASAFIVMGLGGMLGFALRRSEAGGALRYAGATIAVLGFVTYLVPAANGIVIRLLE